MGSKVLVVIDVQAALGPAVVGGDGEPSRNNPDAEQVIAHLLDRWRAAGEPVIHVVHDSTEEASQIKLDLPGGAVQPEAAPADGEPTIVKHVNSGFIGTDLEERLRRLDAESVTYVGLTTNHCVSTTVRMSGNLGFNSYVVSDATATFGRTGPDGREWSAQTVHDVALASLHGEFAEVVTAEQALIAADLAPS